MSRCAKLQRYVSLLLLKKTVEKQYQVYHKNGFFFIFLYAVSFFLALSSAVCSHILLKDSDIVQLGYFGQDFTVRVR